MKRALCALICMALVAGCSKNPENELIGRWQEVGNPMGALEFSKDHTGRAYWPDAKGQQQIESMRWTILKGENKVSVITPPGPVNFTIKNDRLVAPNGAELTKVK